MIVAIDAECLGQAQVPTRHVAGETDNGHPSRFGLLLEEYAGFLVRVLTGADSPLERVVVLTHPSNHARFEPLRDERCDVAMISGPLFEGRPVEDWTDLLTRHPRAGSELLAAHQQEKLRIMGQTGASVIHFPADAQELMEMDAAVVLSIHGWAGQRSVPLSALLADAIVVDRPELARQFDRERTVSPNRMFIAPWHPDDGAGQASGSSTRPSDTADKQSWQAGACAALCEAYEHALASFELRKAA